MSIIGVEPFILPLAISQATIFDLMGDNISVTDAEKRPPSISRELLGISARKGNCGFFPKAIYASSTCIAPLNTESLSTVNTPSTVKAPATFAPPSTSIPPLIITTGPVVLAKGDAEEEESLRRKGSPMNVPASTLPKVASPLLLL